MKLTKVDIAEAHIVTAVRAHFRGDHSASIYLLASAAREILTTIGEKKGTRTMLAGIAESTGIPFGHLTRAASEFAGFLKHADRDPTATIDTFTECDADMLLFVACVDFGRIAGGKPIEAQVFEAWHLAQCFEKVSKAPLSVQPIVRRCIKLFPGIRAVPRTEQKEIGWKQLEKARLNPTFRMEIQREVIIPGN